MPTNAKPASLTRRLSLRLSLVVGAVSLLVTVLFAVFLLVKENRVQEAFADNTYAYLTQSLEKPLWNLDTASIKQIAAAFSRDDRICHLLLTGSDGETLFSYSRKGVAEGIIRKGDIRHNGEVIASAIISFSHESRRESLQNLIYFTILTNLIIFFALVLGTGAVVRTQLRVPLNWLKRIADAYSGQKVPQTQDGAPFAEFGPFLVVLSEMAGKINLQMDDLQTLNNALRTVTERLQLATRAAGIGIWDWDVVKNEVIWDDAMYRLYGTRKEDFGGAYEVWSGTIHPEDKDRAEGDIQAALRGERDYAHEFRVVWPDGSIHHLQAAALTFRDKEGKPLRMVGINYDITERKRKEEELKRYRDHLEETVATRTHELEAAKNAAESANQAKSMFLANMSHEIRTPMNAVLGFAQLLERDPSLPTPARNKVSTIMKSGEHLLSIINDILEMSRIEAGRVEMRTESVDLHNLLDELAVMFRMRAEEKALTFALDLAADLPRYIVADLGKLRQIMINLLGNAVKFTRHGSITMRALLAGPDRIAVEVQDTGISITLAEQGKLFRPFERTRNGEQAAGGSGLGLAISRKYARLMGGEVTVASHAGEGSCFRLEFPAPVSAGAPVSAETPRRVIGLAPGQGAIRVLVVDDQPTNRILLREMLEPLGFIVDEACDGREAVEQARSHPPRIILMDLVMPDMDGIEATQILRKTLDESTAIIGISASAFQEEKQLFLDASINAFIAKAFREQELFDVLVRYAGVAFETEAIPAAAPNIPAGAEKPTLEKMPAVWREAFPQALAQGSITQLRRLGEEAREFDTVLSAYVLERVALYDLDGLKKLCCADI